MSDFDVANLVDNEATEELHENRNANQDRAEVVLAQIVLHEFRVILIPQQGRVAVVDQRDNATQTDGQHAHDGAGELTLRCQNLDLTGDLDTLTNHECHLGHDVGQITADVTLDAKGAHHDLEIFAGY